MWLKRDMPPAGVLRFDYVMQSRPAAGGKP